MSRSVPVEDESCHRPHPEAYGLQQYRFAAIPSAAGSLVTHWRVAGGSAATVGAPSGCGSRTARFAVKRSFARSDDQSVYQATSRKLRTVLEALVLVQPGRRIAGDEGGDFALGLLDVRDVVEFQLAVLAGRLDDERATAEHPVEQ